MPIVFDGCNFSGGLSFAPVLNSGDPYWNYTTYLLSTTSTNTQQNNTFIDGSTNNYTIVKNGNATQGSVTPYYSLYSNYFNNNYISAADNVSLQFGTGNFTVECWVNSVVSSSALYNTVIGKWGTSFNTTGDWTFRTRFNGTNQVAFTLRNTTGYYDIQTSTSINDGLWHHIAVVRDSLTTIKLFVDGVLKATQVILATDIVGSSATMSIGSNSASNTNEGGYTGYISNARIVKGTALYTGNFTVPTPPLTAISGTSLLTCQSNRFIDNSSNAFTLTPNSNPAVAPFTPIIPSSPVYSTAVNGGSGYFDGVGDYLSSAGWNAAGVFGTSDFTVECWVYATGSPQNNQVIWTCNLFPSTTGLYLVYYGGASNSLQVAIGGAVVIVPSGGWSFNAWHHVAVVRSGTTLTLYIDGVAQGSATISNNFTDGLQYIGRPNDTANYAMQGFISNLRIVKGTAVYTSNFTVPTAPLTAIANTSLLLNFTNAGAYDAVANAPIETIGSAQVSTAQAKYGTTSVSFNGTTDGLKCTGLTPSLVNSDFTWECWVNFSALTGNPCLINVGTTVGERTLLYFDATNGIRYAVARSNADQISIQQGSTAGWSTGTWYHVAVVRNGNNYTIYRDGTSVATGTSTYSQSILTSGFTFGYSAASDNLYLNGYLDEIRITNGIARYTSNFTPPTAPFPVF